MLKLVRQRPKRKVSPTLRRASFDRQESALSSIYLSFMFGTAVVILGVMIDAIVGVSRKAVWKTPRHEFIEANSAQALQSDSSHVRLQLPGDSLSGNDGEWRLTA